jgi:UDP-glucose 4-epimerase
MHLARERMLCQTLAKGKAPLFLLRASLLFGARDTHNGYGPNRFVRAALKEGRITLFGEGEEKRDHVSIKDLSRLIGLALAHRSQGVLNGATGESVSFRDAAERVAELVGGGVKVEGTPRQNPITHRHFDITATRKAFPEFRFTPLKETLAETLREVAP